MAEFGKRNRRDTPVDRGLGGTASFGGDDRRDQRFDQIRQAVALEEDPSASPSVGFPVLRTRSTFEAYSVVRRNGTIIKIVTFCLIVFVGIGKARHGSSKPIDLSTQNFQVLEEPERIVLDWTGPVEPPMNEKISAALDKFRTDPRRIVLVLNSPGGNVAHGRAVMASIRDMGRLRRVDTRLEADAICASMCVPIYMQGARRSADPAARFMFHEAKLAPSAARMLDASAASMGISRKSIEQKATSILYTSDLRGTGVSWQWLGRMRADIVDREVWRTARQLKDEESGIVVALGPEGPE